MEDGDPTELPRKFVSLYSANCSFSPRLETFMTFVFVIYQIKFLCGHTVSAAG